jgi:hypothetical protein
MLQEGFCNRARLQPCRRTSRKVPGFLAPAGFASQPFTLAAAKAGSFFWRHLRHDKSRALEENRGVCKRIRQEFAPSLRDWADWGERLPRVTLRFTLGYFPILPAGRMDAEAGDFIPRRPAKPVDGYYKALRRSSISAAFEAPLLPPESLSAGGVPGRGKPRAARLV